jgi:hypothetical protein
LLCCFGTNQQSIPLCFGEGGAKQSGSKGKTHVANGTPNKSLDASGGDGFRNLIRPATLEWIRAAASTQTLCVFFFRTVGVMGKQRRNKNTEANERRYWVWVTRPEYYLDEQGNDREDLDPESGVDSDGWWTCHGDTQKGDLVLLYRSRLKRDIGYLIQTESDAYSIADDEYASEQDWDYGCDYRILYKFENPLTLQDMRGNPYLHDWGAYSANFRRRVYEIPLAHWQRLSQALS